MSAHSVQPTNLSDTTVAPVDAELSRVRAAAFRRGVLVNSLRALVLIAIVGGWEIGARAKIIDAFFWGQPSGIWAQLLTWVRHGTAQGPLWEQIVVTLEEAVLGFFIGVALGVF